MPEPRRDRIHPAGFDIHPLGWVALYPSIGAYVGADIVADIVATGLVRDDTMRLLVDVGTNGEIACGNLKNREEVLSLLSWLPKCEPATYQEVLLFIDRHRLMGRGIGYVDPCLLAAAMLAGARIWTRARRLATIAAELMCAHSPAASDAGENP